MYINGIVRQIVYLLEHTSRVTPAFYVIMLTVVFGLEGVRRNGYEGLREGLQIFPLGFSRVS